MEGLSEKFDCVFLLPPFKDCLDPFFDITEIKEDVVKFRKLLMSVKKAGLDFRFVKSSGKKNYMGIYELISGTNRSDK